MLDFYDDHPGEVRPCPVFIKLVSLFLDNPVVAMNIEPGAVGGFQVGIRRCFPESAERVRKVSVVDHKRVSRSGMFIESFRQKHTGAEVHRTAPEFCQEFALHFHVFDVFGIPWGRNQRYSFIQGNLEDLILAWVDAHHFRSAVEIAGCPGPLLSLSPVHWKLDRMAVGAVESLIHMKEALHPVFTRGNLSNTFQRIAENTRVDHG